jgi:hypothetical protein
MGEAKRRMAFQALEPNGDDPEDWANDRLIRERLRELHGEAREWTNDEWEAARNQLVSKGKVRPDEDM